jgi:hypothetical protein
MLKKATQGLAKSRDAAKIAARLASSAMEAVMLPKSFVKLPGNTGSESIRDAQIFEKELRPSPVSEPETETLKFQERLEELRSDR